MTITPANCDLIGSRAVPLVATIQGMGKPRTRWIDARGYVRFGDDYEHRLVVQEVLGRPLTSDEIVHHKNHDPGDNRPENLEVVDRRTHQKIHAAARTHCRNGHPWSSENTYIRRDTGGRQCRACAREADRRRRGLKATQGDPATCWAHRELPLTDPNYGGAL